MGWRLGWDRIDPVFRMDLHRMKRRLDGGQMVDT